MDAGGVAVGGVVTQLAEWFLHDCFLFASLRGSKLILLSFALAFVEL